MPTSQHVVTAEFRVTRKYWFGSRESAERNSILISHGIPLQADEEGEEVISVSIEEQIESEPDDIYR